MAAVNPASMCLIIVFVAIAGCTWILAHDPPVHTTSPDCRGVGEEKCGPACCDQEYGWHCNVFASPVRCEYAGEQTVGSARDGGAHDAHGD